MPTNSATHTDIEVAVCVVVRDLWACLMTVGRIGPSWFRSILVDTSFFVRRVMKWSPMLHFSKLNQTRQFFDWWPLFRHPKVRPFDLTSGKHSSMLFLLSSLHLWGRWLPPQKAQTLLFRFLFCVRPSSALARRGTRGKRYKTVGSLTSLYSASVRHLISFTFQNFGRKDKIICEVCFFSDKFY